MIRQVWTGSGRQYESRGATDMIGGDKDMITGDRDSASNYRNRIRGNRRKGDRIRQRGKGSVSDDAACIR